MSYDPIQERIDFEEAEITRIQAEAETLPDRRKSVEKLKDELAKAKPEQLKRTRKSDLLPIVEVITTEDKETLIFSDGNSSKVSQVRLGSKGKFSAEGSKPAMPAEIAEALSEIEETK